LVEPGAAERQYLGTHAIRELPEVMDARKALLQNTLQKAA
jgi:hypothetical protein